MKYAVRVPFDGTTLYVVDGSASGDIKPKLFDTEDDAWEHAEIWGDNAVVVEYKEKE